MKLYLSKYYLVPNLSEDYLDKYQLLDFYWEIKGDFDNEIEMWSMLDVYNILSKKERRNDVNKDSIVLLYRPNVNRNWEIHPCFYRDGKFLEFNVLKGQIALAKVKGEVEASQIQNKSKNFGKNEIIGDFLKFNLKAKQSKLFILIRNYNAEDHSIIFEKIIEFNERLNLKNLEKGVNFIFLKSKNKVLSVDKIIIH